MKTKNMRKKALLSSVAMLLVAVVALSGATYAWFANNSSAKATGLNFMTNEASSLLFAAPATKDSVAAQIGAGKTYANEDAYYADAGNWVGTYSLSTDSFELIPCSAGLTNAGALTTFVRTDTVLPGTGDETTTKVQSFTGANGEGVYSETFYVKNTTTVDLWLTGCSFPQNNSLAGSLRYAITVGSNATQIFAVGAAENGVTRKCITAVPSGTLQEADAPTFTQLYTGTASVTGLTIEDQPISTVGTGTGHTPLARLTGGGKQLVTVTVWLEGNDQRCNSGLMGASIDTFTFTFGVTAVNTNEP